MGDAAVLSHCSLLRNPCLQSTCVLRILSGRRNQLLVLYFPGRFLPTASLRRRTTLRERNFRHAEIHENYTSEFRELFEVTM